MPSKILDCKTTPNVPLLRKNIIEICYVYLPDYFYYGITCILCYHTLIAIQLQICKFYIKHLVIFSSKNLKI